MPNWFSYFLTMMMTLMLVVGGSVCLCTHAHAMGAGHHDGQSEEKSGGELTSCGCVVSESSEDDFSCQCQCSFGCDGVAENDVEQAESVEAAVVMHNELDGFELPELQPRFKALFAVWFADFLEPLSVRESEVVAELIDPGPPRIDVPIYLQNQNLRL